MVFPKLCGHLGGISRVVGISGVCPGVGVCPEGGYPRG